jgi:hypothetical protein
VTRSGSTGAGWRHESALPTRLVGIGLPLTIVAGTLAGLALFPQLNLWTAAALATMLAPTDAALGLTTSPQWVMSTRRLDAMVRSVVRSGRPTGPAAQQGRDRQMTEDAYSSSGARRADRETSGTAVGFILFAAIMMIMAGVFQALQGIIAIFENEFYVATRSYTFQFDATTWGWIHLLVGLLVAFAGWGLLSGRTWARVVALTLAVLSAITNFLFIPYYPFWALPLITLDILVMWDVAAKGGHLRDPV